MDDLDAALAGTEPAPETARSVVPPTPRRHRHQYVPVWRDDGTTAVVVGHECRICWSVQDPIRSKRGKTSRDYGNRAELKVARTYGGTKVGHHGGPVDVRGKDWHTQVKTHRRLPPAEWRAVFAALEASTDRLPRLLLRFVHDGGPTDYIVVPGKAWLDWFGKDEETE
jgi:hypothetical protein